MGIRILTGRIFFQFSVQFRPVVVELNKISDSESTLDKLERGLLSSPLHCICFHLTVNVLLLE